MKLSFSTLPCEGWSVEQLIDRCKRYGYSGVELKIDYGYAITPESSVEEVKAAAEKFREAGIAVTNIGSSVLLNGLGEEETARLALSRHIRIAELLGAGGIRIFTGSFFKKISERNQPHHFERLVTHIQDACDEALAGGSDVGIWIETHNEFSTGAVLKQMLEAINRPNCQIIYDIIHPYEFGETPDESIRLLGSSIAHVHMKDGVPFEDEDMHEWKYTLTGAGQLPLASIVSLLQKSGYDGYYSLEWETKWRPELKELHLDLDAVLEDYVRLMGSLLDTSENTRGAD
jgi:3-dehydroshikimate dehydratase